MRVKSLICAASAAVLSLTAIGCDVETKRDGELPKVNVKDPGAVPKVDVDVDVKKTQDGRAPNIDVDPGRLPDVKVTGPDINVTTRKADVTVPDIDVDVNTKKSDVTVPDIDIKTADEKKAEDATR